MQPTCEHASVKRYLSLAYAFSLISLSAAPLLFPMPAQALDYPQAGVVCDAYRRICFDATGASVTQTRLTYGYPASRRVEQQLARQPNGSQFVFSSGERCDLQQRTCWDNSSGNAAINTTLSRQLFGSNGGPWPQGTNGWNQNPNYSSNVNQVNTRNASCRLSQRGRELYSGDCALRQRTSTNGVAYVIELPDGHRYPFFNRRGQLVMRDSSGTWPAQSSIRGNDVQFVWSDLQLVTRPLEPLGNHLLPIRYPNGNPYGYPSYSNPNSNFLQNLFNTLFR